MPVFSIKQKSGDKDSESPKLNVGGQLVGDFSNEGGNISWEQ